MSATKNDQGKLRYDLIPPEALRELARVYTIGAKKYGDNNWRDGLEPKRILAAMLRHLEAYRMGERNDPDDGQQHMASVAWGAFALLWQDQQPVPVGEPGITINIPYGKAAAISSKQDAVAEALDTPLCGKPACANDAHQRPRKASNRFVG